VLCEWKAAGCWLLATGSTRCFALCALRFGAYSSTEAAFVRCVRFLPPINRHRNEVSESVCVGPSPLRFAKGLGMTNEKALQHKISRRFPSRRVSDKKKRHKTKLTAAALLRERSRDDKDNTVIHDSRFTINDSPFTIHQKHSRHRPFSFLIRWLNRFLSIHQHATAAAAVEV
jgi:hypothetical protein